MEDQLVTVETYQFLPQAQAAQLQLEGNGITVFLADAEKITVDWLGNAISNIKLQVPHDQAEKADHLLEEMQLKASRPRDFDDEVEAKMFRMASKRSLPWYFFWPLLLVFMMLFAVFFGLFHNILRPVR